MTLTEFNQLNKETALAELLQCCGSDKWTSSLIKHFPFSDEKLLIDKATGIWYDECSKEDYLQAFSHHPKIGDIKSLEKKFAGKEQESVASASADIIQKLAKANTDYEAKFGFIFIVCATGKSANEMLRLLNDRIANNYDEELNIAMGEQHKITIIRFKKLLEEANWQFLKISQITTHILDTSIGKPGQNLTIRLQQKINNNWQTITQGVTNADGRITDLLPPQKNLSAGNYKMVFETGNYFTTNNIKGFYPEVEIQFTVFDDSHYHVPLLINPFGYSTYRGS